MSKDAPSTADAVKAGRLALSKEPFGSPADIGEHLAHAIYAEHVTFNPLMLGGKHVESDPTPAEGNAKKYKERAVESYKFYQQLKTEERKLAASILQKRLLEISPESKEAEEINAIYNGIYLAAIKDGEEIEGRPPPSAEIRGLYNVLAQTGNETDLLGTVSDLSEPSNYAKIIQTYGKLPMAAFNEVVGGEKGPYSGIVKALSARSPSGGSALHPDKQNFLKQIAAELMMDSVLLADPVLHSRNGDVATPEERRMFRDRAVQESQEAQGAMDDLIENLGNLTDLDDPDVEVLRNGVRDIWRNAQRDAINNAFPDRTETPTSAEAALEGDLPIEDVGHARVNPPLVPPVERTASWIHGYSLIPWNI